MTPLLWAIVLLAVAIGIVVVEMFVPSGGLLAVCSGAAILSAVGIVFVYHGPMVGSIFFAVTCVLVGATLAGVIKWWPYTAIGRRVLNLPPGQEQEIASPPDYQFLQALVGQHGMAVSKMVPGGVISLVGESYDAVSQAGVIDEGTPVTVVSVDGTRIIVREADAAAIAAAHEASGGSAAIGSDFASSESAENESADSEIEKGQLPSDSGDVPSGPRVIPNPFEDPLV